MTVFSIAIALKFSEEELGTKEHHNLFVLE